MTNICKGDDGTKREKNEREKNIGLFFDIETSRYRYSDKEKEEKAELINNLCTIFHRLLKLMYN